MRRGGLGSASTPKPTSVGTENVKAPAQQAGHRVTRLPAAPELVCPLLLFCMMGNSLRQNTRPANKGMHSPQDIASEGAGKHLRLEATSSDALTLLYPNSPGPRAHQSPPPLPPLCWACAQSASSYRAFMVSVGFWHTASAQCNSLRVAPIVTLPLSRCPCLSQISQS